MPEIRLLVVESDALASQFLVDRLGHGQGITVVGQARGGAEAVALARKRQPTVVLAELPLPGVDGVDLIRHLREVSPHCVIVVLTARPEEPPPLAAVRAGATGVVPKGSPPERIVAAVRAAAGGEGFVEGPLATQLMEEVARGSRLRAASAGVFAALTRREAEVLRLLAEGLRNQEIAARLFISERTVRNHASSIFAKLGVDGRMEAALLAVQHGLADPAKRPLPPLASRGPYGSGPPHNLPRQVDSFVGRAREREELHGLLAEAECLTLTGSGGSGKSRLAIQVAADLVANYPDGVWLVELAPLSDPALVVDAVARSVGLTAARRGPLLEGIIHFLRARHLLLILDNCEHLLEPCARLVCALLRNCPGLRLLATSREPLGVVGEVTYRVPSLSTPEMALGMEAVEPVQGEAVRLFADRARAVDPSFAISADVAPTVASICRRLDGIPLAIELAAAQTRSLPLLAIEERLDRRFGLLTGGARTAPPRHQTLRAAVDWSYELLSEQERRLFAGLAAFAGGWTLEAVSEVAAGGGLASEDVVALLARLVSKSLVLFDVGTSRYRLLETLRAYGLERLQEGGEMNCWRARHRDYFLALAERAEPHLRGPDQIAWFDFLDRERDNLRAALRHCLDGPAGFESGCRMIYALCWVWVRRGGSEGALDRAAARARQRGGESPRPRDCEHDGSLLWGDPGSRRTKRVPPESFGRLEGGRRRARHCRGAAHPRPYGVWPGKA